jgi:glycosyltransferase involved in cell wall biosynthesis
MVCALSAQAVATGLTTILDDPERAAHMGQAGLQLVRENYTWPRIAVQTIDAYQRFETGKSGYPRSQHSQGTYIAAKQPTP